MSSWALSLASDQPTSPSSLLQLLPWLSTFPFPSYLCICLPVRVSSSLSCPVLEAPGSRQVPSSFLPRCNSVHRKDLSSSLTLSTSRTQASAQTSPMDSSLISKHPLAHLFQLLINPDLSTFQTGIFSFRKLSMLAAFTSQQMANHSFQLLN